MYFCRCSAFHRLPLELFLFLCVTRSSKNSCVVIDVDHYSYYAVNIVIFWCYSVLMYIVLLYTVVYTVVLLLIYTVVYTVVLLLIYTVVYTVVYTAIFCYYCLLLLYTCIMYQVYDGQNFLSQLFQALFQALCSIYCCTSSLLLVTVIYCV